MSYHSAFLTQYSDVWIEATTKEFDGILATGTLTRTKKIIEGSNIVDAK